MTDYFVLLGLPRQPWLEPGEVQARFLKLSETMHPDRVHGAGAEEKSAVHDQFTALNAAWQCLRDSKTRLRHLLELESGVAPVHLEQLPLEQADFYFKAGQVCRQADGFLAETAQASPLAKAQRFGRSLEWLERLDILLADLNRKREELETQLKELNSTWAAALPVRTAERSASLPLERLERIYRELSYISRWIGQVGERRVQLSI